MRSSDITVSTSTFFSVPAQPTAEFRMYQQRQRSFFFWVSTLALFTLTNAKNEDCQTPLVNTCIKVSRIDRLISYATHSPAYREIQRNSSLREQIDPAFSFFRKLSEFALEQQRGGFSSACNLDPALPWPRRISGYVFNLQFGELQNCFSQIDRPTSKNAGLGNSFVGIGSTIFNARSAMYLALKRSIKPPEDGNWTTRESSFLPGRFNTMKGSQTCTMDGLKALRVNNTIYIRGTMTNERSLFSMPEFRRQSIHEWISDSVNGTSFLSPQFRTGQLVPDSSSDCARASGCPILTSTYLSRWSGNGYSVLKPSTLLDDSAIAVAYKANLQQTELSSDSVTLSNLAILSLPMAMAAVPVAFLGKATATGTVAYVLFTDVFSTLPIFMRGIELITSARPQNTGENIYFAGNSTLLAMEVFFAECRGEVRFQNVGIVLVVVSSCVMVAGIALELWAVRYMKRIRKKAQRDGTEVRGPFGSLKGIQNGYGVSSGIWN